MFTIKKFYEPKHAFNDDQSMLNCLLFLQLTWLKLFSYFKCQTNSELVVKIDYLMNIYQYITHDASEIIKILLSNKNTKCWHLNTGLED